MAATAQQELGTLNQNELYWSEVVSPMLNPDGEDRGLLDQAASAGVNFLSAHKQLDEGGKASLGKALSSQMIELAKTYVSTIAESSGAVHVPSIRDPDTGGEGVGLVSGMLQRVEKITTIPEFRSHWPDSKDMREGIGRAVEAIYSSKNSRITKIAQAGLYALLLHAKGEVNARHEFLELLAEKPADQNILEHVATFGRGVLDDLRTLGGPDWNADSFTSAVNRVRTDAPTTQQSQL